jgi:tetratricopeptide (TPR) repeat protein
MSNEPDWQSFYEESQQAYTGVYLTLAKENAKRDPRAHEALADEFSNLLSVAALLETQTQWPELMQLTAALWEESEFLPDRGPGRQNLPLLEAGLQAARSTGDQRSICLRLISLGETYRAFGEIENAIRCFEEALSWARLCNDTSVQRTALYSLGLAWIDRDVSRASEYFQEAQKIPDSSFRPQLEIDLLSGLAAALIQQQNYEMAGGYIEKAYRLALQTQDTRRQADLCYQQGYLFTALTEYSKARESFNTAANLYTDINHSFGQARALQAMGTLDVQLGQVTEGLNELERVLKLLDEAGDESILPMTLIAIGQTYAALGKKENALQNLERAQPLIEKYNANPRIAMLQAPLQQLLDYAQKLPSDS